MGIPPLAKRYGYKGAFEETIIREEATPKIRGTKSPTDKSKATAASRKDIRF